VPHFFRRVPSGNVVGILRTKFTTQKIGLHISTYYLTTGLPIAVPRDYSDKINSKQIIFFQKQLHDKAAAKPTSNSTQIAWQVVIGRNHKRNEWITRQFLTTFFIILCIIHIHMHKCIKERGNGDRTKKRTKKNLCEIMRAGKFSAICFSFILMFLLNCSISLYVQKKNLPFSIFLFYERLESHNDSFLLSHIFMSSCTYTYRHTTLNLTA